MKPDTAQKDASEISVADIAITTSFSSDDEVVSRAVRTADDLTCPYFERSELSLAEVRSATGKSYLMVFTSTEVRFVTPEETFWFHPNMASARIEAIRRGDSDRYAEYLGLKSGDRVLDGTCGLGADAIVASHLVGPTGSVRAIEKSPVLGALVREGMKIYAHRTAEVEDAMRRVEVVTADAMAYLSTQEAHSWDVVYFDPMFEGTLRKSQGLEVVRRLACQDRITDQFIDEAGRVARRCVVMKDRVPGRMLASLGFEQISRKGRIYYGMMRRDGTSPGGE
jgi:16S rRNA (guanine1516-N2)-methyltransferase